MKIEINNLGIIQQFTIDLAKDLHLIYGKNNVGKSYAVHVVYLVLKSFKDFKEQLYKNVTGSERRFFNAKIRTVVVSDSVQIIKRNCKPHYEAFLQNVFNRLLIPVLKTLFINSFDGVKHLNNVFGNKNFEIKITFDFLILSISNTSKGLKITSIDILKLPEIKLATYNKKGFDVVIEDLAGIFLKYVKENLDNCFHQIYFLPASRSGLYQALNGYGQILVQISQYRHVINKEFKIPTLPTPVSDYYLQLASLNTAIVNTDLATFATTIEEKIFKGATIFNEQTKQIFFQPKNTNLMLPLVNVASMIAELSPLVLYIKHIISQENANGENILIIEEPEAHLHPSVQVKLMDILSELTKKGLKIILTSHSNYMFNKLGNKLLAKEIEPEKVGVYHLVMTEQGSILQDDMEASEEGIEDNNFITVSEALYEERMHLYDQLNEEENAAR